jgi:uncharacterized DUF497 family protein
MGLGAGMILRDIIWKERFAEKLHWKHGVTTEEVEEVLFSRAYARKIEKGRVSGEDLYMAYGRTQAGRYLVILFILKARRRHFPSRRGA